MKLTAGKASQKPPHRPLWGEARERGQECPTGVSNQSGLCPDDGTPEGTRTPDPLLRRQLLYPPELQARMERVMGIEPTRPAWKAGILPLNYTRIDGRIRKRQLGYDSINQRPCQ